MQMMMAKAVLAVASIAVSLYQVGFRPDLVTVDGQRLLRVPRPAPFHLRWLLPTICRGSKVAWRVVTTLALIAVAALWPGDIWAAALFVSLPWFRTMVQAPVLVDAPALLAVVGGSRVHGWPSIPVALLGAGLSEKVPVMLAAYGQRFGMAFVGLVAVAAAWKWIKGDPREGQSAYQTGITRSDRWSSAYALLLPWGACLAALLNPSWTVAELVFVAVAYGQCLLAWDNSRLYMWAAPVVTVKAVAVIPARWRHVAVMATWFNPWATPVKGEVLC